MADTRELQKTLDAHLLNIKSLARSYDDGDEEAASGMASDAGAIFQDGKQAASLLGRMGLKNSFFLLSTTTQYIPAQKTPYYGLLSRRCLEGEKPGQGSGELTPIIQLDPEFVNKWHGWDDWWNELVANGEGYSLSRREVVLMIAQQSAGLDSDGDQPASLGYDSSSGWIFAGAEGDSIFEKRLAYATMRQIAFEILKSFEYHNKIKSYTRKGETRLNAIHFDGKVYFASYQCEKYPMSAAALVDPRRERIETREVCFDMLTFKDGTMNGRILAI